ncbi:hypothetical protein [Baekduia sp.]|uniref:hypothetical protein n=1 Tax=Baekduia sp. TaxID=2600305 RepID=UPI002D1F9CE4|nr:hypothetical protein [Baekduia sp.]
MNVVENKVASAMSPAESARASCSASMVHKWADGLEMGPAIGGVATAGAVVTALALAAGTATASAAVTAANAAKGVRRDMVGRAS